MSVRHGVALALALSIAGAGAAAKDIPKSGISSAEVVAWLQNMGYKAQVVTGHDGKVHILSASDGIDFGIYMFDCNGGPRCGSIQFAAGFATHGKFPTAQMNAWNRDHRWARGYFDNVNDPWVEYDVDLTPGGTYELLNDEFATWRSTLTDFTKKYNLR